MFWLYNLLFLVLSPIWAPYLWWKNRNRPDKVDWRDRQGLFDVSARTDMKRIWVHAVSVGETIAVKPILERVRAQLPDYEIIITNTTGAGHRTSKEQLEGIAEYCFFFPLDIARFQFNAMQRIRPSVVVVVETELWLNFLTFAKQCGAITLLVNGRISDRSFARSGWIRPFLRATVRRLDRALMQTQTDADRIRSYGAIEVEVLGNSKFDQAVESGPLSREDWRKEIGASTEDFVVIVGSTRGEIEESIVLPALAKLEKSGLHIVYAPRHMERVEAIVEEASRSFETGLRSRGETAPFLVLDTYGELSSLYAAADVAIIGGGFGDFGGQNLIQALAHGVPVIHGPHMHNFKDTAAQADTTGAGLIAADSEELLACLNRLREDPQDRSKRAAEAMKLVRDNLGASDRYADAIVNAAQRFQTENAEWLAKRKSVESKA